MALGDVIPTFVVYEKATGKPVIVDERTFNAAEHSREPMGTQDEAGPDKRKKKGE